MKKHKLTLVIVLGLVLCLLCGMTTTFSWFTREYPKSADKVGEDGDTLKWSGQYKISNGQNISIKTVESNDDGTTFGENEVTDFGGSLQTGKRRYFCTEISNAGNTDQNVSLFINQLKFDNASDSLYIGVNSPLKTYKEYSGASSTVGTATTVQNNTMRVYFQHKDYEIWSSGNIRVYFSSSNTINESSEHIDFSLDNYLGKVGNPANHTNYVDIPTNTKYIYYKSLDRSDNKYRTAILNVQDAGLSSKQSVLYYLSDGTDSNGYQNVTSTKVTGANITTSYGSIIVPLNGTFTSTLESGTDYTGTMEYYSGDDTVFTVNKDTGVISPQKVGTAILYMKVKGDFGDKDAYQLSCKVTVTDVEAVVQENVPIVTNLEVGAAKADGATVSKVYWYIKNDSSSEVKYTLSGVYISL